MQIPHGFCRTSQVTPEKGPKDDPSHKPRVHHIPIHVEGRSDSPDQRSYSPFTPSSSANFIDMCDGPEVPVTRGRSFSNSSNPNLTRSSSSVSDAASQRSFSSASVDSNNNNACSENAASATGKKIRQIPITIEADTSGNRGSNSSGVYSFGGTHSRSTPSPGPNLASFSSSPRTSHFSPSGPHVTSIPVNISKSTSAPTSTNTPQATTIPTKTTRVPAPQGEHNPQGRNATATATPTPPPSGPKSPMVMIDEVNAKLDDLKNQINQFSGDASSKQYRYLDEMLTRLLISCDDIDTQGDPDIRSARKGVINSIHQCIALLESKTKANEATVDDATTVATAESSTDVPMNEVHPGEQPSSQEEAASTDEMMSTQVDNEASEATPPPETDDNSNVQCDTRIDDDKESEKMIVTEEADSTQDVPMSQIDVDPCTNGTVDDGEMNTSEVTPNGDAAFDETSKNESSANDVDSSSLPESTITPVVDKSVTQVNDETPHAKPTVVACQ